MKIILNSSSLDDKLNDYYDNIVIFVLISDEKGVECIKGGKDIISYF